ncbi:MAG: LicD family protein [Nocardioides sp.]|nr:LicD family protein [Nocardioides sp.]
MSAAVDREGLAGVHDLVRRLLGELDRVATLHAVPFYLAYGTAIGAARDADLIPWDVDADVWVRREHYTQLVEVLGSALGPDFELLTPETHPDYEYLFPRLVLRGVHHVYVRVDVFPLDPAPRTAAGRTAYLRLMRLLDRAHFVKHADTAVRLHYSPAKRLLTRALRLALLPVPAGLLRRVFRRLQAAGDPAVLVNSCGSYGEREFFDAAWFADTVRLPVHGVLLPAPVGFDALLTHLYGDWRTPVPPAQQQRELEAATSSFVEPLRAQGLLPGPGAVA